MAYLFFDADSAGQTAAVRSVDALYDAGIEVKVMLPPDKEDPDSVAQKYGAEAIIKTKDEALRYFDFRFNDAKLKNHGSINSEKLIKEVAELLRRIQDSTRRELLVNEAAEALMVNPLSINKLLPSSMTKADYGKSIKPPKNIVDIGQDLLALIMHHSEYIETVREKLHFGDFNSDSLGKIYKLILTIYDTHGAVSETDLIEMADNNTLNKLISSLAKMEISESNLARTIDGHTRALLRYKQDRLIKELKSKLKEAEEKHDSEAITVIETDIKRLISSRDK